MTSLLNLFSENAVLGLLNQDRAALSAPIAIMAGAVPGALSRYYITAWSARWLGIRFPFGTFLINLSGALLMGFFATLAIRQVISSPNLQLLITTGFLGSYTTFSTYALDACVLWRSGSRLKFLVYWLGSVVIGGICLEIGIGLGLWIS